MEAGVETGGLSIKPYSGLGFRYLENDLRDLETAWYLRGLGYLRWKIPSYLGNDSTVAVAVIR